MESEKVILVSKYNYYKYYDMRRHIYHLNYQEKKQREADDKTPKNYYYNYWKNCEWKKN
jgi:hypothetical protein